MEMQILDVDYIIVNDMPVIRLFGKTADGKSVCGFYEKFLPYFYVKGAKGLDSIKTNVLRMVQVKMKEVGVTEPATFTKVVINNPAKTPEYRQTLQQQGLGVFEADILFKYRFMNDINIRGMGWVSGAGDVVPTNTVTTARTIRFSSLTAIEHEDVPLSTLALDIECVSLREGTPPEARRDPIIMMSMAFEPTHKKQKDVVLSTRAGKGVVLCESERSLLEDFIDIVNEYDPDIITGFNINNFDIPYILERMRQNRVRPLFGRCRTKQVYARKFGARQRVGIAGRIIVDSFEIVRKDFSLQRYGLDFVSRKLLNNEKEDVKHSEIEVLWKGPQDGYERLVGYSRKDSILALDLVLKLNLLDKYIALAKITGTLLQDTIEGGETGRIEHFLLREFNRKGYVLPCKPAPDVVAQRDKRKKEELVGGYVLEPEKMLHSNVVVLDFKSMYPSIIRTFNICPTTLNKKGTLKTASGACFVDPGKQVGIVPHILQQLMEERQAVKKVMKNVTGEKKRIMYAKQWALKILANAFYGYLGYSRARAYEIDVANAITATGRDIIGKTVNIIRKQYKRRVVYGDTDSVFVVLPMSNLDEMAKEATKIATAITKDLPGIMELEYEKTFRRFLPLTKKRYVAWSFVRGKAGWEEGLEMKGVETVRRDWCELVGDTMGGVIDVLLKKDDVKGAVRHFRNIVEDLAKGNVPIQKLVVTKTMTKSAKSYMGIQPHIELVKKMQIRSPGEAPGIGDRIPFVIVKGTDLLSKRAEDPMYVVENGLEIDSHYYVENQLLPPLERIFYALGISKSELLGAGRQIGIMDVLKRENGAPTKNHTITLSDVRGFMCEKCSAFYPHIPLLGICKCGGKMVFTSQNGRADVIEVN